VCRLGANSRQVPLPGQRHGPGGTTFRALERRLAGRGFAPIDASRGEDERVFDSLHGAGIDIKLVGNPTNGLRARSTGSVALPGAGLHSCAGRVVALHVTTKTMMTRMMPAIPMPAKLMPMASQTAGRVSGMRSFHASRIITPLGECVASG
jgi:hypothetical protein